jgi:hypothetical protein
VLVARISTAEVDLLRDRTAVDVSGIPKEKTLLKLKLILLTTTSPDNLQPLVEREIIEGLPLPS